MNHIVVIGFLFLLSCKVNSKQIQTEHKLQVSSELDTSWSELSNQLAKTIDGSSTELNKTRPSSTVQTDQCIDDLLNRPASFAESIGFFILDNFQTKKIELKSLGSTHYGVPQNNENLMVSLNSQSMCEHTKESIHKTLKEDIPPKLFDKINQFSQQFNHAQQQLQSTDHNIKANANQELFKLWFSLFGCMSYQESLATADSPQSKSIAANYLNSDFEKPEGVKFSINEHQNNSAMRLSVGLFQFTPHINSNINSCISSWNKQYPKCQITDTSRQNLTKILSSTQQHFNSYCALQKTLQTFHVQMNTTKSSNTAPQNNVAYKLKENKNRCVTLQIKNNLAHNHFDSMQGSNISKLDAVYSCTLSTLKTYNSSKY